MLIVRCGRIGSECARWGGALREDTTPSALSLAAARTPDSRARAAAGPAWPCLQAPGIGGAGGRARRSGGRNREADSFVSFTRGEGSRPTALGCRCGRLGTSAGSTGRWRLLRGWRTEGGPGRRPGGGASAGAGARGLHLRTHGLRPSAEFSEVPGDERQERLWAATGAS